MRLQDRRALLIGAASGIGRETAAAFVREGARVVVADRNREGGLETISALRAMGADATFQEVDVTDEAQVADAVANAVKLLNGLDVLANFAGVQRSGVIEEFPTDQWELTFATNVRSQFLAIKYAVPVLRQSRHASIINMASIAGLKGGPGMTVYSASKGAVIAFTKALAAELAPTIRVNSVSPGWIDTPFNQAAIDFMHGKDRLETFVQATVPLRRQGNPQEIAPIFVYLASDESSYVTGQTMVIDGGLL